MQEKTENKSLTKINGIGFTPREIDIISCIINGRPVKSIALLLGISTNTINSHIKNIMSKANCFAKDQIIKLVESSENHALIDNVYIDLLIMGEFKKLLSDISKISADRKFCLIHVVDGKINEKFCDHIKMAGIDFSIEQDPNISTSFEDIIRIVQCSSAREVKSYSKNTIFLIENNGEFLLKQKGIDPINNYLYAVLECIQAVYRSDSVDDLVKKFKQYYDRKRRNDVKRSDNKLSINKKLIIIFLIVIFSIIAFVALSFLKSKKNNITLFDAPIISEDVLLQRKNLIRKIDEIFKKQKGIKFAILIGEGGAGKTVISRNYLKMNDFKVKAEINAETYSTIVDSFIDLANVLANTKELREEAKDIATTRDHKIRDKLLASFVFSNLNKLGNWCLLFDNVDILNMIKNFIPNNSDVNNDGKVLITTRNKNFKT